MKAPAKKVTEKRQETPRQRALAVMRKVRLVGASSDVVEDDAIHLLAVRRLERHFAAIDAVKGWLTAIAAGGQSQELALKAVEQVADICGEANRDTVCENEGYASTARHARCVADAVGNNDYDLALAEYEKTELGLAEIENTFNSFIDHVIWVLQHPSSEDALRLRMGDDFNTAVKQRTETLARALKEARTETLARLVDLENPALAPDERLRRARRLVGNYRLRRAENPNYPASPEVRAAFSIINKENYRRRKAKAEGKTKLAM